MILCDVVLIDVYSILHILENVGGEEGDMEFGRGTISVGMTSMELLDWDLRDLHQPES